ncbi:MAG: pyridoxal phosphate-dependent aminotransferase [Anaerolineales bacterium]|nr:pyridoxal phosphate-dependent aminotransferase [Anaerolineales bacterium]MCL4259339.1 pyridoxal phosphate-dependent aminotransferase [Anaerolineales bacterium]
MTYNFDEIIERRHTNSIKWTAYPEDVLPMWVADMDFSVPEPIRDALHQAIERGEFGYAFATRKTKQIVAERMQRLYGWSVDPDWVMETTGVVSGFNIAARAYCRPSDGALIQTPAYPMFYSIYKNMGLTQQTAPLSFVNEGGVLHPQLDLDAFARSFHSNHARTRMFLLCHPYNPTGQVFSREELLRMAETCLQNGAMIISDEIHCELLLDDAKHIPTAALSPEIADRTVTLISPSKTFNIAGLFSAFAIIPNAEAREKFKEASEKMTGHPSSLGLIAAETAFSGACDDWLNELRLYLARNRNFVMEYLAENFPQAKYTHPAATYLHWIDFGEYVRMGQIVDSPFKFFLENAKVAVNDGKPFGAGYENFIRLNFGAPRALVEQGLSQMKRALMPARY